MGSAFGSLVGGLILGIMEKLVGGYVSPAAAEVVAFVLLIGVLTIRPQGLFGKRETVKV
ncbi:branched-chain amino acid ABC transporter permease [Bordetella pertussis]|nr:branched-chain amino acid ABC transporter permease [Bordetella pertussis]CPN40783.1 branched-chain amino acid ABC transporter permease [Bordetella pertussis]